MNHRGANPGTQGPQIQQKAIIMPDLEMSGDLEEEHHGTRELIEALFNAEHRKQQILHSLEVLDEHIFSLAEELERTGHFDTPISGTLNRLAGHFEGVTSPMKDDRLEIRQIP